MSLALAAVAALSASTALPPSLPACSWNRPGHNPFTGDVVAAVDRYADIPAPVRQRLKARMASRSYDEIVSIRRDSIVGQARYRPEIRDMHFGSGQVCGTVDRMQWAPQAQERGLVYCEAGHCILVPTVCRNVSRIRRDEPERAASSAAGDARGAGRPGDAGAPAPGSPAGLADAPPDSAGGMPVAGAAPLLSSDADSAAAPLTFVDGLRGGTSPTQAGEAAGPAALAPVPWRGAAAGAPAFAAQGPDFDLGLGVPRSTLGLPGDPGPTLDTGPPAPAPAPMQPVPEPQSWALLLGGLAALAWPVRAARRQRAALGGRAAAPAPGRGIASPA